MMLMLVSLPDFDRYQPDEVLVIPGSKKEVRIFRGKGKKTSSSEHVINLMHGWLGEGTQDYIAGHLSQQGHDVFTFDEHEWHPDRRARNAHAATKTAMEHLKRPTVEHMVHSDAVRALVKSVLYQQDRDPEQLTYEVKRITTVDGNGTNGIPVNPLALIGEVKGIAQLARQSTHTSARVYGKSIMNLVQSPVNSVLQGVWALRYDAREDIGRIQEAGVPVVSVFQKDDYVIRPPEGALRVLPGSHMTAIILPDTMIDLAS